MLVSPLRRHESFPPVVIYFTFLQHILRISCLCKVPLLNSQMERTICGKFWQNQNPINITWKCRLKVFSSRNSYYVCSKIWTNKFSRISHCGFVTLRSWYWHVTILIYSMSFQYRYFMCKEQIIYLIFLNRNISLWQCRPKVFSWKKSDDSLKTLVTHQF